MSKKTPRAGRAIRDVRTVFESIRKPVAPPGHPMTHAKPDEKARPSLRKAKHKRKPETAGEDD